MDACRREIGERAARIIAARVAGGDAGDERTIVFEPKASFGDTLLR